MEMLEMLIGQKFLRIFLKGLLLVTPVRNAREFLRKKKKDSTKELLEDYLEGIGEEKTATEISDGTAGGFPERYCWKFPHISGEFLGRKS